MGEDGKGQVGCRVRGIGGKIMGEWVDQLMGGIGRWKQTRK